MDPLLSTIASSGRVTRSKTGHQAEDLVHSSAVTEKTGNVDHESLLHVTPAAMGQKIRGNGASTANTTIDTLLGARPPAAVAHTTAELENSTGASTPNTSTLNVSERNPSEDVYAPSYD
ncbi:hypothetical protein EW026_g7315 [Hermanssonia centrifuga]|uniref:Uncharacterized protein n=1 Tax=Hermanssonia centrifuga TaxID=98765 RepID=A0A4S4K8G2_9APHY|nr:hypothetical protein EW026_g7315 [Hermanssonia centrifuga]